MDQMEDDDIEEAADKEIENVLWELTKGMTSTLLWVKLSVSTVVPFSGGGRGEVTRRGWRNRRERREWGRWG